jgi:hypothetical protein
VLGGLGQLGLQGCDDPVELGVHLLVVGLVEHGPDHGGDPPALRLGHLGEQVPQVVRATALPARSGQGRADRVDQAAVGVGGHQLHAAEPAGGQAAEEGEPAGAVLGRR